MSTDEELQIFRSNIRLLRKQKKLTQKEMASFMGICVGTLRGIERGSFPPRANFRMLVRTSRSFHIPIHLLFRPIQTESK